ncbi:UDP-N-acetylmuramyl pentapeptide phosphotransferase [Intrasporangium chromatireducens Q5-1]|uniref:UDP-N-acetylmuramyl pentapeptide phosphotransferase n=1 Tax=Intrasporangium chromatireducens Q5-1 TaxID=584657 RepID=W9GPW4_9MICO|nr:MraY family glycosyltransferase [Intrasporangium chromatireducens]EWT05929.1 UDP-N-acetylmuramyl pentapeptide phosphotransferase [Intrasporangium chromatireducens Q5-1]
MHEYVLILIVAAGVTYIVTPFVRSLAVATGAFTPVRERDVHKTPIPRLGGVGIYLGFVSAALVARSLPYLGTLFSDRQILGIVAAGGIVCLLGAFDDIRELDWLTKLAGQILAAGLMAYAGVQLLSLPVFGVTILPTPVLVAVTVLVVIVSTNAVNFIDGLDGLAAGVVGIAALAFFMYSYIVSRSFEPANVFSTATFVSAALVGCCAGFLPHNFHPARLFMGDSGALTLGLLLSAATITLTGNVDPGDVSANQVTAAFLPVLVPLAVLLLPLLDMVLAVVRRTRAGQRPWQPDAMHLHHRMLRIGHGHRRAVLILYMWAAIVALGSVSLVIWDGWTPVLVVIGAAIVGVVLTLWLPKWSPAKGL